MKATLKLVRFEQTVDLALQGDGDPNQNDEFSLYELNGKGSDPIAFRNCQWEEVEGVPGCDYDTEDFGSFLAARRSVINAACDAGILSPSRREAESNDVAIKHLASANDNVWLAIGELDKTLNALPLQHKNKLLQQKNKLINVALNLDDTTRALIKKC